MTEKWQIGGSVGLVVGGIAYVGWHSIRNVAWGGISHIEIGAGTILGVAILGAIIGILLEKLS